ncbi:MAG: hypothetical protein Q7N87_00765 [Candidatus Uhrbacteria bacterium]|nr:hypothetical protein [Candidatus Uhrbacteria bacterium]
MENPKNNLTKDIGIIVLSVIVAIVLIKTGAIEEMLKQTQDLWFLDSFIAGMFFTSVFTTVPAMVALGETAQLSQSVLLVAIFGGLGALCGDLIIFRFMRDRFGEDILRLIRNSGNGKLRSVIRLKSFRWLTFFLGALIIASPLPDELGLTMMGFSKTKTSLFIPVSFIFNFLGILVIGLVAKNLLGH